jgi:hypothetical protein
MKVLEASEEPAEAEIHRKREKRVRRRDYRRRLYGARS